MTDVEQRHALRLRLKHTIHDHHDERDVFDALVAALPLDALRRVVEEQERLRGDVPLEEPF